MVIPVRPYRPPGELVYLPSELYDELNILTGYSRGVWGCHERALLPYNIPATPPSTCSFFTITHNGVSELSNCFPAGVRAEEGICASVNLPLYHIIFCHPYP